MDNVLTNVVRRSQKKRRVLGVSLLVIGVFSFIVGLLTRVPADEQDALYVYQKKQRKWAMLIGFILILLSTLVLLDLVWRPYADVPILIQDLNKFHGKTKQNVSKHLLAVLKNPDMFKTRAKAYQGLTIYKKQDIDASQLVSSFLDKYTANKSAVQKLRRQSKTLKPVLQANIKHQAIVV